MMRTIHSLRNRRRRVAPITYLSIRKPVCFLITYPWKQIVSIGETNCFHGRNKQFLPWKLMQRLVIVSTKVGYCYHFHPLSLLIKSVYCPCIVAQKNVWSIHRLTFCIYVSQKKNVGMYGEIKKNLWRKLQGEPLPFAIPIVVTMTRPLILPVE